MAMATARAREAELETTLQGDDPPVGRRAQNAQRRSVEQVVGVDAADNKNQESARRESSTRTGAAQNRPWRR